MRFARWLETLSSERTMEELEVLDLDDYLRGTSKLDLPAEERLRLLAVKLELAVCFESTLRSWAAAVGTRRCSRTAKSRWRSSVALQAGGWICSLNSEGGVG